MPLVTTFARLGRLKLDFGDRAQRLPSEIRELRPPFSQWSSLTIFILALFRKNNHTWYDRTKLSFPHFFIFPNSL